MSIGGKILSLLSICTIIQTCYFSRHKGTVYFDCFKNQHQQKLLQQPITKDELKLLTNLV